MKKLILTSMLTAVGLFAQSGGTTPAQPKSNTTPASQGQTPAPAPAKTSKHKHKKNSNASTTPAVKDASKTPTAPATPASK